MALRTVKNTRARNRNAYDPSLPRTAAPAVISEIESTAADTIRLTFATRVQKNKLPLYRAGAGGGAAVESAVELSATEIELTFDAVVQGTNLLVAEGDPGIRTVAGGFVPAGVYAIPVFP